MGRPYLAGAKPEGPWMTIESNENVDLQLSALVSGAAGFPIQVIDRKPHEPETKSFIRILFGLLKTAKATSVAVDEF
jgi:hypothetical protein